MKDELNITDAVRNVQKNGKKASASLAQLQDFYTEMKENGIAKKPEYKLPTIDTVDMAYYNYSTKLSVAT